jgi:hypothetical protein
MGWSGGIAEWSEGQDAYVSIAFSWLLPKAYQRCAWLGAQGYTVHAGGPALFSNRQYLDGVAVYGEHADALIHHNPQATIASRGCPVGCGFCIVPKSEGRKFALLPEFTPRPILCDNNLSALPVKYQEYIIEKYKRSGVKLLDAQSGFEPHSFNAGTYTRWNAINRGPWRYAYDETSEGEAVYRMTRILSGVPASRKRVYVLIGNEPFEDCYGRIMRVIEWGCEPHVQPLIELGTLEKHPVVRFDWTEQRLRDLARWANRWIWRTVKFCDYKHSKVAQPGGESAE